MKNLLIIGAGGHGKVVADIAELMQEWDKIAFVDDYLFNKHINKLPVIGMRKHLLTLKASYSHAFVAIGNNKIRLEMIQELKGIGYHIPVLIHPKSILGRETLIGEGTVIMAGAILNPNVKIGKGCIVNTAATVDHDCILENGVHLSPGTHLAGTVTVGQRSWIGIGSTIINNITIGRDTIVAAGATVTKDVMDGFLVAGVPAIVKKKL